MASPSSEEATTVAFPSAPESRFVFVFHVFKIFKKFQNFQKISKISAGSRSVFVFHVFHHHERFLINPLQIFGSNLIRQSFCISLQKQGQISPLLAESDNLGNLNAISYISFSSHLDGKDWIDNPKKIHS